MTLDKKKSNEINQLTYFFIVAKQIDYIQVN